MKTVTQYFNRIAISVCFGIGIFLPWRTLAQPADQLPLHDQISQVRIFGEALLRIGNQESPNYESAALLALLQRFDSDHAPDRFTRQIERLEQFVIQYPVSPWTPALHAAIGMEHRRNGRYSTALAHWEQAWNATKQYDSGPGQRVADYVLANWAPLLSSLGRVEKLRELHAANNGRILCTLEWERKFKATEGTLRTMDRDPGVSYRCGTLAVMSVGIAMGTPFDTDAVKDLPSPESGFSMARLLEVVKQHRIDLIPVLRTSGTRIVVPSVIHWRENHYAAIVAQRDDLYQVTDPTFGGRKWFSAKAINAEASGYFLVSSKQRPSDWATPSGAELENVFGKGANSINPPPEQPPCDAPPGTCCRHGGGGGGSGGGPGGGGCGGWCYGRGMPAWTVTEPFISVHLKDVPVSYSPSAGNAFEVKMYYGEHEERTTNYFGFGPQWCSGLLSYVHLENTISAGNFHYDEHLATVYGLGGGQLKFLYTSNAFDATTFTSFNRVYTTNGVWWTSGVIVQYPNGSSAVYGLKWAETNAPTEAADFFLTQFVEANGVATTFNYSTNSNTVLLTQILDADGKTNTVVYDTTWTTRIKEISTPYDTKATFGYDVNGVLTNIVDAVGLTNGFQYQLIGGYYIITNLNTPYGNTVFAYVTPADPLYGAGASDGINRAVTITEPNLARHLFMYRDDSYKLNRGGPDPIDFIPFEYTDAPAYVPVNPSPVAAAGLANHNMRFRNSFYWGPRQYDAVLATNISQLSTNDYLLARLRNWLHSSATCSDCGLSVGTTLNMERDFSPQLGVAGQKTWYGYVGKFLNWNWESTNNNLPAYVAQRLPDGGTRFVYKEYNALGHVTLERTTNIIGSSFGQKTMTYTYAANGIDLLRIIGYSGVTNAAYGYNGKHQITAETNAVKHWTLYSYDANGRLTGSANSFGLLRTNIYGADGRLAMSTDEQVQRTESFTYSGALVHFHTNELGAVTTNLWDGLQRLVSSADSDGFVSNRYTYLDLTSTRDRLGNWTSFVYDSARNLTNKVDATGTNVTTYNYCNCGALVSIIDALNNTNSFYYDQAGRLTSTVYPDGSSVTLNYDSMGQVTNRMESSGLSVSNRFDNHGLLLVSSNAFGQIIKIIFDIEDRATNKVDANGVTESFTFDALGRNLTVRHPDNGVEAFGYTASARAATSYTNQLTNVTTFAYDAAGRKTNEVHANVDTNSFSYDAAGNVLTLTDGRGRVTTWDYDSHGRLRSKVDHDSSTVVENEYNAEGRLTKRTTPEKGDTFYTNDVVGNLTFVSYPNNHFVSFSYDRLNRLSQMVDGVGTTRYTYDRRGNLQTEDGPWADDAVSYSYTNSMRRTLSLQQPNASAWEQSYAYDAARRLTNVTSPVGPFGYSYDGVGSVPSPAELVAKIVLPNGAYVINFYDIAARIDGTHLKTSGNVVTNLHGAFSYDLAGQRTSQLRAIGPNTTAQTITYEYDKIGQLISAVAKDFIGSIERPHEKFGYAYDAGGNLKWRTNNLLVQTFVVDNVNQLSTATRNTNRITVSGTTASTATSVTIADNGNAAVAGTLYADRTFARTNVTVLDGNNTFTAVASDSLSRSDTNTTTPYLPTTVTFIYDRNGNLRTNSTRILEYDDENQLIRMTEPTMWKVDFTYDGKMRRRTEKNYRWNGSAWMQTSETRFVYDGNVILQERNEFNVPVVTLTRGKDLSGSFQGAGGIGGLLAFTDHSTLNSGNIQQAHVFYHSDGRGNVTALMDWNQNLAARYIYDPFGNTILATGPRAALNRYRFSSKPIHESSGMYDYLYRWYAPELQRWGNRDPIGEKGGLNLYAFVHNDPLGRIDRFGNVAFGWPVLPPPGYPPSIPQKPSPKCTNCDEDNPAKEMFKTAADNLASALHDAEKGGKVPAIVRLLLLAADAKNGCGDMKEAGTTCVDFARQAAKEPGYAFGQSDCEACCHGIMNSFPGLGGFSYFSCHAMCARF